LPLGYALQPWMQNSLKDYIILNTEHSFVLCWKLGTSESRLEIPL